MLGIGYQELKGVIAISKEGKYERMAGCRFWGSRPRTEFCSGLAQHTEFATMIPRRRATRTHIGPKVEMTRLVIFLEGYDRHVVVP